MNNTLKAPRVKHYIEVLKQKHYMAVIRSAVARLREG